MHLFPFSVSLSWKSEMAVTCPHETEGGDKSPDVHGLSVLALCLLNSHRILHFLTLPFLAVGIKIYFKFSHFRVSLASYKCCTIKYIFMSTQAGWLPCQETEPCRWAGGRMTDTQLPVACCLYLWQEPHFLSSKSGCVVWQTLSLTSSNLFLY